MHMSYLNWGLTAVSAFLLGVFVVNYLVVHPLSMSLYLFLACLAGFLLLAILAVGFRGRQLLVAVPVALVVFLAGYSLMTYRVLVREDPNPLPALSRAKGDPGDGHTAVIYLTHGEPETYDPIGWINTFREFDKDGIPFIPALARPFFFQQLRQHYLRVGKSNHRQIHMQMIRSLEAQFRAEGDTTTKFYISFLDDDPRPDAAAIQALNDGASHIVVSLVFLTVSNHTAEGIEMIEAVNVEVYGATLTIVGPLWDSTTLRSMFVQRANQAIGDTDKSRVGVLLVGHGQPDEWDKEFPTETQQEIAFREEILKLFEADGYQKENLGLAWMEFKKPKPKVMIEEMAANGVDKIVFFSAAISADGLHSQYDVPALIQEAQVPADIPRINLGAWNDDPIVIRAIKERIETACGL
jgi:sirohydrochlorin ferrochelatase